MTVTSPCGIDPTDSGHALTGQAFVSDQAATRLAPSGFDPSCNPLAALEQRLCVFIGEYCRSTVKPTLRLVSDMAFALGAEPEICLRKSDNEVFCSFCKKSSHAVAKMIQEHPAAICNECVVLCVEIIDGKKAQGMSAGTVETQGGSGPQDRQPGADRPAPDDFHPSRLNHPQPKEGQHQ